MYLVSACLCGANCRYDGGNCLSESLRELVLAGRAIAVCPEVMGGLPVPRERCELTKDSHGNLSVVSEQGSDFTAPYVLGAKAALFVAATNRVTIAVLKSLSPSCGFGEVYDGSFSGARTRGRGLAAQLLAENGIQVLNEHQLAGLLER